jgi:hypothetical protein
MLAAQKQYLCTREQAGPLILEGSQEMRITKETYCVSGGIELRGNARLVITDALLVFREGAFSAGVWGPGATIRVRDNATVELKNVQLYLAQADGSHGELWFDLRDSSRVLLDEVSPLADGRVSLGVSGAVVVQIHSSPVHQLRVADTAQVSIRDSAVGMIDVAISGKESIELVGLRPQYYGLWGFPQSAEARFSLRLEKTRVGGWSVRVNQGSQVYLADCYLNRVVVVSGSSDVAIRGVRPGFFTAWSLRDDACPLCRENVVLLRTRVDVWYWWSQGTTGTLSIADSEFLRLFLDTHSRLVSTISNTTIGSLNVLNGHFIADMSDVIIEQGLELNNARLDISGRITFPASGVIGVWTNSRIDREYLVVAKDESGHPLPGVALTVEDPSGSTGEYVTGQDGIALLALSFDNVNARLTWLLTARFGTGVVSTPIGLLTSSPVELLAPLRPQIGGP